MRRLFRRFIRDTKGQFGLMLALSLVPIMGAIGAAVDYSRLVQSRSQLQAIADGVVLGAVARDSATYKVALKTSPTAAEIAAQKTRLKSQFLALASAAKSENVSSVDIDIQAIWPDLHVSLKYAATADATILAIIGKGVLEFGGTAEARNAIPKYIDFHLALDVSQSMGIMATKSGMDQMQALVGCVFGCHTAEGTPKSFYQVAVDNKIPMRIDVVRGATKGLVDDAESFAVLPGQYRVAIDTMGDVVKTITPLTANMPAARAATAGIDLGIPPANSRTGESDFTKGIPAIAAKIGPADTGQTASKPAKVFLVVTDGLQDITTSLTTSPFDPNLCTALKTRGVKVAVIYTTYIPNPIESTYNLKVAPHADKLQPNLLACSSPGLFFEGSDTTGIQLAFREVFRAASAAPRITN